MVASIYSSKNAVASTLEFVPKEIVSGGNNLALLLERAPHHYYSTLEVKNLSVKTIYDLLNQQIESSKELAKVVILISNNLTAPGVYTEPTIKMLDGIIDAEELRTDIEWLTKLRKEGSTELIPACCGRILKKIDLMIESDQLHSLKHMLYTTQGIATIQAKFFNIAQDIKNINGLTRFNNLLNDVILPIDALNLKIVNFLIALRNVGTIPEWSHLAPYILEEEESIKKLIDSMEKPVSKCTKKPKLDLHKIPLIEDYPMVQKNKEPAVTENKRIPYHLIEKAAEQVLNQAKANALKDTTSITNWDALTPFELNEELMLDQRQLSQKTQEWSQYDTGINSVLALVDIIPRKTHNIAWSIAAGALELPKFYGMYSGVHLQRREIQLDKANPFHLIQSTLEASSIEGIKALFKESDFNAIPVLEITSEISAQQMTDRALEITAETIAQQMTDPVIRGNIDGRKFIAFKFPNVENIALLIQSQKDRPQWILSNGNLFDPAINANLEIIGRDGFTREPNFSQTKEFITAFMRQYGPNKTVLGQIFSKIGGFFS